MNSELTDMSLSNNSEITCLMNGDRRVQAVIGCQGLALGETLEP